MPEFIRAAADPISQQLHQPQTCLGTNSRHTHPILPVPSAYRNQTSFWSTEQASFCYTLLFFTLQDPPSPASCLWQQPKVNCLGKSTRNRANPHSSLSTSSQQHQFSYCREKKEILSTQTNYRMGAPGSGNSSLFVHCISANSSSREKPLIPSPILHSACFGLARHQPVLC